jgi:hypothetical protein
MTTQISHWPGMPLRENKPFFQIAEKNWREKKLAKQLFVYLLFLEAIFVKPPS